MVEESTHNEFSGGRAEALVATSNWWAKLRRSVELVTSTTPEAAEIVNLTYIHGLMTDVHPRADVYPPATKIILQCMRTLAKRTFPSVALPCRVASNQTKKSAMIGFQVVTTSHVAHIHARQAHWRTADIQTSTSLAFLSGE